MTSGPRTVDVPADERARLDAAAHRLITLAARSRNPEGGFGRLDAHGRITPAEPVETWITCRMTHVFALAHLHGDPRAASGLDHGVRALRTTLKDHRHGGWLSVAGHDAGPKDAYAHAFVLLAAASAVGAGHPDAVELLEDAAAVVLTHFWDGREGMVVDSWDEAWSSLSPYRGVNANMHMVEAFLAVGDVTADARWHQRAESILTRVVDDFARSHQWRLPEHFDAHWTAVLDHNENHPDHPFQPYGVTIGHLLEWSRLTLHLDAALQRSSPPWARAAAADLYDAGVRRGWDVDGAPGFVYTTDFSDRPVVRQRLHWVVAEAIAGAWTLYATTGEVAYLEDHRRWWAYASDHLIDPEDGSWRHELDPRNAPSSTVWTGRPDVYHAYQATVLPLLPHASSLIGAASGGW